MINKRTTIPFSDARTLILEHLSNLAGEEVNTLKANGRALFETIYAPFSYPYFRRSGYDGYAIRADDDEHYPITLNVVGEVACGEVYQKSLKKGETVRIMTGAKVPENGAKIIMLEQSQQTESGKVTLINTQKSSNITEVGTEFAKGDILLEKGTVLNAGAISLLQAFGITTISVVKKPRIAIFSTGSELISAGTPLPDGKIYNSNEPLLETLVGECGGQVAFSEQLTDDYELTLKRLKEVTESVDLIITTGGVSVGDFDFMAKIATDEATLLFNKIQMRPGSPTTAMIFHDTLTISLSGNPGACFTGFHLFVEPALKQMASLPSTVKKVRAIMAEDYLKNNGYDRFLRGSYYIENGVYYVKPVGSDMSSALGNLHLSTCLIMIPRGKAGKESGEEVEAWLLSSKS